MRGAECEPLVIFFTSVPQIPQVWTRTRTSPGPISGIGTFCRRTSFLPKYTAACIVSGSFSGAKNVRACVANGIFCLRALLGPGAHTLATCHRQTAHRQ